MFKGKTILNSFSSFSVIANSFSTFRNQYNLILSNFVAHCDGAAKEVVGEDCKRLKSRKVKLESSWEPSCV